MRSLAALTASFAIALSLTLSGCSSTPDQKDETAGWNAQRIHEEAREAMDEKAWDRAIKLYETLESRYPYGRYSQQAQLNIAYANFKQGEPTSALAACDRFIRLHPNHVNVDYAYYLKGLINFNEDQGLFAAINMQDVTERDPKSARESFEAFKELATKFPNSRYTPDATARMKYLVNSLASHEVHVAHYYFKRGAYLAAIGRAQEVLKKYDGAPAVEDALIVIVKAYDALGMQDLRDDNERVLKRNFPNSRHFANAANTADSGPAAWWKFWE